MCKFEIQKKSFFTHSIVDIICIMMMFIISSKWQLYIMTPTWTNQLCGAQPVSEGVSLCHQQENLKIDIFPLKNIDGCSISKFFNRVAISKSCSTPLTCFLLSLPLSPVKVSRMYCSSLLSAPAAMSAAVCPSLLMWSAMAPLSRRTLAMSPCPLSTLNIRAFQPLLSLTFAPCCTPLADSYPS